MATMNVSLPEKMKKWAEAQVKSGKYGNTSDYVRDLIRKDLELTEKTENLRNALKYGEESGIAENSLEDIYRSFKTDD